MIAFGLYGQNAFFYAHYMELYRLHGSGIDPYLANKVFETFINLEIQKDINISRLSTLIKYGLTVRNMNSLSGIYAEDDMLPSRYSIALYCSKFSSLLHKFI